MIHFKGRIVIRFLALILLAQPAVAEREDVALLMVKPNRCIALHKGQTCYQKLKFTLRTPASGEYCLYKELTQTPLSCWSGNTVTTYIDQFKSDQNLYYQIRSKEQQEVLGEVEIHVSWVYKSKKRRSSGWRVF